MIIGITGACRCEELVNMTLDDIEDKGSILIVKIPDSKTNVQRKFIVDGETSNGVNVLDLFRRYIDLRSPKTSHRRLFVSYRVGKCSVQVIGKNSISKVSYTIAKFLGKENAEEYTGHCLRRSSATLLVDAGADILSLKRHGGWKSTSVAEGYLAESIPNKHRTTDSIICGKPCTEISSHQSNSTSENETITQTIPTQQIDGQQNSTKSIVNSSSMSLVSDSLSGGGFSIKTANNCTFNITLNK